MIWKETGLHKSGIIVILKDRVNDGLFFSGSETKRALSRSNLLQPDVVPSGQQNTVHTNVHWDEVCIAIVITIHSANNSFASSDQKACGTVDVVHPTRQGLQPSRDYFEL